MPQFYLRRFAIPETRHSDHPQIWAFPIDKGEEFYARTRNVAAKRDLYTYCGPEVDQRLGDLESFLGQHWSKFADDHYPVHVPFKKGLGLFISTLYLRHPAELERQRHDRQMWAKLVREAPRDASGKLLINSISVRGQTFEVDPAEIEALGKDTDADVKASWGERILGDTGQLAKHLLTLPWSVIFSDKPAFVTTDHPVALGHATKERPGFRSPGTIIHFPISPTRLLVIGDPRFQDGMIYPVKEAGIADFISSSADLRPVTFSARGTRFMSCGSSSRSASDLERKRSRPSARRLGPSTRRPGATPRAHVAAA